MKICFQLFTVYEFFSSSKIEISEISMEFQLKLRSQYHLKKSNLQVND